VTEHFVLQTARSIGTGEATSRAGLYVATLSSGLVATGFASGKTYFGVFLGAVLIVVLALVRHVRTAGRDQPRTSQPSSRPSTGWDVAAGLAGAALSCWLMLRFESRALDESI
jgi:hypothetical protein